MRFLGFEILSPEENMKRDEELLLELERGSIPPSFRIYEWKEVCISLGKNQDVRDFPVKVVRRPTGGSALLHGWDISFSVIGYRNGKSPIRIYREFSDILINVFKELGVKVFLESNKSYNTDEYFCFFFPTFGELKTSEGKKIVALAMRTMKKSFLIHGSVYKYFDYETAGKILGLDARELKTRITSLKELGINPEEFKKRLCSSLLSLPHKVFSLHS
ncbi:lipoyl protein ligase domain-containing protein [Aquifex sp.]